MSQYGPCAARTAREVVAHRGRSWSRSPALAASLTAKKTAPAGMLPRRGAEMPRKQSPKSPPRSAIEYAVPGICSRTVAVSSGYLTAVLVTVRAAPEMAPEIDSSTASALLRADREEVEEEVEDDEVEDGGAGAPGGAAWDGAGPAARRQAADPDRNEEREMYPPPPPPRSPAPVRGGRGGARRWDEEEDREAAGRAARERQRPTRAADPALMMGGGEGRPDQSGLLMEGRGQDGGGSR